MTDLSLSDVDSLLPLALIMEDTKLPPCIFYTVNVSLFLLPRSRRLLVYGSQLT